MTVPPAATDPELQRELASIHRYRLIWRTLSVVTGTSRHHVRAACQSGHHHHPADCCWPLWIGLMDLNRAAHAVAIGYSDPVLWLLISVGMTCCTSMSSCYEQMHDKHWSTMLCRSDLTLVCSPLELSLLQSLYCIPSHKLCNAPFFAEAHSEPQHESRRAQFMTIGNWKHPPNRDSVQWLCQSIWPAIRRQLPHAELHIYGAHMSGAAQQHHKPVSLLLPCTDLPRKWSEFALPHSRSVDSQSTLACLGCLHPHHEQSPCNVQAHY
jgi:hypothetical protein